MDLQGPDGKYRVLTLFWLSLNPEDYGVFTGRRREWDFSAFAPADGAGDRLEREGRCGFFRNRNTAGESEEMMCGFTQDPFGVRFIVFVCVHQCEMQNVMKKYPA